MTWTAIADDLWCPAVVARADGRVVLLGRGAGGELVSRWHDETGWSAAIAGGLPMAQGAHPPTPAPVAWPVAACDEGSSIHLVATSVDGELLHAIGDGESWEPFETLGHPAAASPDATDAVPMGLTTAPAACASPAGLEVFTVGLEGDLLHTRLEHGRWTPFQSLGLPPVARGELRVGVPVRAHLAACAPGDRLLVLLRGPEGDLMGRLHDGVGWGEFTSLGNPTVKYRYPPVSVAAALAGEPAAVARSATCVDVVVRGPKGDLLYRRWDAQGWSDFHSLGMPRSGDRGVPFLGDASICAVGSERLHVVARALDGRVHHAVLDGSGHHAA